MRPIFILMIAMLSSTPARSADCTIVETGIDNAANGWVSSQSTLWTFLSSADFFYADDIDVGSEAGRRFLDDRFLKAAEANHYSKKFDTVAKAYSYILDSGVWSEVRSQSEAEEIKEVLSSLFVNSSRGAPNPGYTQYTKQKVEHEIAEREAREKPSAVADFKVSKTTAAIEADGNYLRYAALEARLRELDVTNAERRQAMISALSDASLATEMFPGAVGLRSDLGWSTFTMRMNQGKSTCPSDQSSADWRISAASASGKVDYFGGQLGKAGSILLSFEGIRNQVTRPWLNRQLFEMSGWSLPVPMDSVGAVSCGDRKSVLAGKACGILPLITTGVLVVRNLRIRDISADLRSWIVSNADQKKEIWLGPLRFNEIEVSKETGERSSRFHATVSTGTISFTPDYILLGVESDLTPLSPTKTAQ